MLRGCSFAIECDHNNLCLDKLALCLTPIVVRWRLYLQGFSFTIRHIPGKQNYLGDFLSRMYGSALDPLPLEVPMAIERCAPINEEPDPKVHLLPSSWVFKPKYICMKGTTWTYFKTVLYKLFVFSINSSL